MRASWRVLVLKPPVRVGVIPSMVDLSVCTMHTLNRDSRMDKKRTQSGSEQAITCRKEVRVTEGLLLWSLLASGAAVVEVCRIGVSLHEQGDQAGVVWQAVFLLALLVMLAGSWAYLIPRRAHYLRQLAHQPASPQAVRAALRTHAPSLSILVPSYKEELAVVRQTLMSAALQDVAGRRVVLLIDDPQHPGNPQDAASLQAMRQLSSSLQAQFNGLRDALSNLRHQRAKGPQEELDALVQAHMLAAAWLEAEARLPARADHTARWLAQAVLNPLAAQHRQQGLIWRQQANRGMNLAQAQLAQAWDELVLRFDVRFSHFERKRYANLSHEPNKAMNLNAYLSLMGGSYHEQATSNGTGVQLLPVAPDASDAIQLPDAEFVLTLDADSLLLPGYAARLMEVMLRPGHARLAVIQTPYSAVPEAPGLCERIAGAQTDIQYLMHQGFTAHSATFWVGANALLRKAAIEDIATTHMEKGLWVKRYIHDRTVIEDTESSIDLVDRGWRLFNYPERLAYSATPPDFGALLIQRRRWADGGLIILPKALRYLLRGPWGLDKLGEAFLRVHYLSSVATVNFAFLLLMFGPFGHNLKVVWIPLAMTAYMVAYARDLRQCGYGWLDFPRVYALNLLLLPVNLGGTLRSLYQACTGRHAAFARTPKVTGRTAMPGAYVVMEYLLLAVTLALTVSDLMLGKWVGAALSGLYALFFAYGLGRFIGWRASWEDLRLWMGSRAATASADADAGPTLPFRADGESPALARTGMQTAKETD
jgi:cellulose synthase (UDP-forming)